MCVCGVCVAVSVEQAVFEKLCSDVTCLNARRKGKTVR